MSNSEDLRKQEDELVEGAKEGFKKAYNLSLEQAAILSSDNSYKDALLEYFKGKEQGLKELAFSGLPLKYLDYIKIHALVKAFEITRTDLENIQDVHAEYVTGLETIQKQFSE
jgi:hypothetical protein